MQSIIHTNFHFESRQLQLLSIDDLFPEITAIRILICRSFIFNRCRTVLLVTKRQANIVFTCSGSIHRAATIRHAEYISETSKIIHFSISIRLFVLYWGSFFCATLSNQSNPTQRLNYTNTAKLLTY